MYTSSKNQSKKDTKRYILYARKSTTSEDRQVASIDSQIQVMTEIAHDNNLNIVEVLSESGSGYKVGRPVFNRMIEKLEKREADGIIVWKLSRLSRNPDDAGKIMGMIQRADIQHIRTVDRNWFPEDNVMMMYVEFGLNNQFSKDLSLDTRRGLTKKAERGWLPLAILPLGYQHTPYKELGAEEIIIDNDRFYTIQQGLRLVASGDCSPVEAYEQVKTMGLRGRRGEEIAKSTWYKMLSQPFYCGTYEFPIGSGNFFQGKHIPAISEVEFDSIQSILGKKCRPRFVKHFFSYTGMMQCGECGCAITAENKRKIQKNGNVHRYIYYRCTKKRGACSQPCTNIDILEPQIKTLLDSIRIPMAFHEWAIEQIKQDQQKYVIDRDLTVEKSRKTYDDWVTKIDSLLDKYIDGKISEEAYKRKLSEFEERKNLSQSILNGVDQGIEERINKLDEDMAFAEKARFEFENGDEEKRKEIFSRLGSNLTITNHKLDMVLRKPLEKVSEISAEVNLIADRFEPLENADNSDKFKFLLSNSTELGG